MPLQPEHGPQSPTNNYASCFSHEPWTFRARGEDEILQSGGRRKGQTASPHRALTHLELPLGKGLAPAVICACRYMHVPGVCAGVLGWAGTFCSTPSLSAHDPAFAPLPCSYGGITRPSACTRSSALLTLDYMSSRTVSLYLYTS